MSLDVSVVDTGEDPMPELPEVETICWRLREGGHCEAPLVGRVVEGIDLVDTKVLRSGDLDALQGRRVKGVRRRAKWIIIEFGDVVDAMDVDDADDVHEFDEVDEIDEASRPSAAHPVLVVHLKMTGDLHVSAEPPARFGRLLLHLDRSGMLAFVDPRRFGHVDVVTAAGVDALMPNLGPEPLSETFTPAVLKARLVGKRALKAILLDQKVIAGIGNIYADEALFLACLHPESKVSELNDDDVKRLHGAIRQALQESIAASREAIAWRYENRSAPSPFRVYDRAGQACLRCGGGLTASTVAGRTSVTCPSCQLAPSA